MPTPWLVVLLIGLRTFDFRKSLSIEGVCLIEMVQKSDALQLGFAQRFLRNVLGSNASSTSSLSPKGRPAGVHLDLPTRSRVQGLAVVPTPIQVIVDSAEPFSEL